MNRLEGIIVMFLIVMAFCSSIRKKPALNIGDLCVIENGEGQFGVAKILSVEADLLRIKLYANSFTTRPFQLDTAVLCMAMDTETQSLAGIAHFVIEKMAFAELQPEVLAFEPVTKEELQSIQASRVS